MLQEEHQESGVWLIVDGVVRMLVFALLVWDAQEALKCECEFTEKVLNVKSQLHIVWKLSE